MTNQRKSTKCFGASPKLVWISFHFTKRGKFSIPRNKVEESFEDIPRVLLTRQISISFVSSILILALLKSHEVNGALELSWWFGLRINKQTRRDETCKPVIVTFLWILLGAKVWMLLLLLLLLQRAEVLICYYKGTLWKVEFETTRTRCFCL